ncbi:hypothetical protein RAS1_17240 [Phycisphaerae bacterium RAS1]|nr:hypothetical protein RAS1_17240 [Phycisphaerae bacterium RAS1]
MLTVTNAALERLLGKLSRRKAAENVVLRLKQAAGRWRLRFDRVLPDDAAFAIDGRKVLVLDGAAVEATSSMTLGVRTTKTGPRLKLRRAGKTGG